MNKIRYNFIVPKIEGCSLTRMENGTLAEFVPLYSRGEFIWAHQTYLWMKNAGLNVSLSYELDPTAINLAHGNRLRMLEQRADCFCVSLQADYPHYSLADFHVVQNQTQESRNSSYVPHWPQFGQQTRDENRIGVQCVAYQGNRGFCHIDETRLSSDLAKHGVHFKFLGSSDWQNLGSVDVLIGIRSFGKKKYKRKPPSKLINAWHADIPFVGGGDSAYTQIGSPGKDFLQVFTYDELLAELVRLKQDQKLYENIVEAGREKAVDYTFDAIVQRWKHLLEVDIARAYANWKNHPARPLRYGIKKARYAAFTLLKQGIKRCYKLPAIKHFRDHYYDPVK